VIDNSDLLLATEWVATLLESNWWGKYVSAFIKLDERGQTMANFHPVIHIEEEPTFIRSLYEEQINLLQGKESKHGIYIENAGFVVRAWTNPLLDYLTSLLGYWCLNNGPCPTAGITHILPTYAIFHESATIIHNIPKDSKKRTCAFLLGHSHIPVVLQSSKTKFDTLIWKFAGESAKDLQTFIQEKTKDILEVESYGDMISAEGNRERIRMIFSSG